MQVNVNNGAQRTRKAKQTLAKTKAPIKAKQNKRSKPQRLPPPPRAQLSKCAQLYAKALAEPFAQLPENPCIPDQNAMPSYKLTVRGTGGCTIGTGGVGFVLFDYRQAANDVNSIYYSTATYTGNTVSRAAAGINQSGLSRLPFTSATLDNQQWKYRVVSAGLRISYSGKLVDRNGIYYLSSTRGKDTFATNTASDVFSLSNTQRLPVRDTPVQTTITPTSGLDYDYTNYELSPSGELLVLIQGEPGTTFSADFISHWEFIGTTQLQTATHSDAVGFGAIRNSFPDKIIATAKDAYDFYNKIQYYLNVAGSSIAIAAAPYAANAARNYLQYAPKRRYALEL